MLLRKPPTPTVTLNDRDLISALSAMCTRYERLVNSGLHYDQPLASPAQHAVAAQVEEMLKQFRETEQKQLGYSTLRDSDVLKSLVFLLRLGHGRTSGRPKSRAFIDFLFAQFPEKQSAVIAPQEAGSRIIVSVKWSLSDDPTLINMVLSAALSIDRSAIRPNVFYRFLAAAHRAVRELSS